MNLKNKTVCFVDSGMFVSFCRNAAKAFGCAYYHKPFASAFPRTNDLAPGRGFEELEWCEQPLLIADRIDLWVFLDLYHSGLQVFLKQRGARVFGAGEGEDMELERWEFKQTLKKLGLPVQHCEHIRGIEELRKYLKSSSGVKFVKTSYVRGDFETFRSESFDIVEPLLDELAHELGVKKHNYEFIVEDEIPDAVEIGYDGFTVNGQFPKQAMMAYEVKDCGMIATVKPYDLLAEPVKLVNSKLTPCLKEYDYNGFLATEIRYTKDRKAYMIDPCCRLGTPSNELLQGLFDEWPEVMWDGAEGICRTPKVKAKFGCLAVICSDFATTDWLNVQYPNELDHCVKLRFHVKVRGKNYTVPQIIGMSDVGCVIGTGDTLQAAVNECKEYAKEIKGYLLKVKTDALDEGLDVIKKGEKYGIKFA